MKKINKEVANLHLFDLQKKKSLLNLYQVLNKEYVCGELHKNLILNPSANSTFLYYELRKDEVILGFKHTDDKFYQQLLKIKDAHILENISENTENSTEEKTKNIDNKNNVEEITKQKDSDDEASIVNENQDAREKKEICNLIKDIKNYTYIQGGALITFHKKPLLDYLSHKLEDIEKKEITE